MTPTTITLTQERELKIVWSDGHIVRLSLQYLRQRCPCAGCQGETDILGNVHMPLELPVITPKSFELQAATPVGNYAVMLRWADGHDTGIYSWEYLLGLERALDGDGG
ncbi:MAG: DUF971 domain-containing protein [Ignavibacteriae bacterium]|nr:DUF971 domain-containing protein [Ignavibacteriota bacterium]